MIKEAFLEGKYYDYYGVEGKAVKDNVLVLKDGRLVKRLKNKYSADVVTTGSINSNGYLVTKFDGVCVQMHRLVAMTFIPNPLNLPVVDHINEAKEDNRIENLRWVTLEDNSRRHYIRDDRALNEARATLKEVADKEAYLLSLKEDIAKERKLLVLEQEALLYKRDVILDELNTFLDEHRSVVTNLLIKADAKIVKREASRLSGLEKSVRSRSKMIEEVGKPILVNGITYPSVRAAARVIVEDEVGLGYNRSFHTVRAELRRIQTGFRVSTSMYGRYDIDVAI